MTISDTRLSKNSYPGGHAIYNFGRGFYGLFKSAASINSVNKRKKDILNIIYINII